MAEDSAIDELEQAATKNPSNPVAAQNLAQALKAGSRPAEAYAWFLRAAKLFSERKLWAKTIAACQDALQIATDQAEVRERLAHAYQESGMIVEARFQLESLAGHFRAGGNIDAARRFERAIRELEVAPPKETPSPARVRSEDFVCSFCGKRRDEVKKLIAGPSVYICNECVALCAEVIGNETARRS